MVARGGTMKIACRKSWVVGALLLAAPLVAAEPDYSSWSSLLAKYYDPARGMDYRSLKARDAHALESLRQQLGRVNTSALTPKQELAYWINVYNVNVVAVVVGHYPVSSIRDISTDPLIRLNVFKQAAVPHGLSLDDVENKKIRERFHDPRIHFAINCAAKSCPPIRSEAFTGERLDAQLDDQVRRFFATPAGVRFNPDRDRIVITTSRILDWFSSDFESWAGGKARFIRRYVSPGQQQLIDRASEVDFKYADYDWTLNNWKR